MAIQKFEDIIAWQKDQICRPLISISGNIAEGFDRQSNKEFIRFLYISPGSTSEVKSLLYLAYKLKYLNKKEKITGLETGNEISRIIRGLIQSMEK